MSVWHKLKRTAEHAGSAVEQGLDPTLAKEKKTYAALVKKYNSTRQQLIDVHDQFVSDLNNYRDYVAHNATLLISLSTVDWNDEQFASFLKDADQPPASVPPAGYLPGQLADLIKQATGGDYVVNALYKLRGASGSSYGGALAALLPAVALGGIGGESPGAVAGGLQAAILADQFGPLSIITIPLEVFEEEGQYSRAIKDVEGQLTQLRQDLDTLNAAITKLTDGVSQEKQSFLQVMPKLNAIEEATFVWQLPADAPDAAFKTALDAAVFQYGVMLEIRSNWERMRASKPDLGFFDFVNFEITKRDAARFNPEQIAGFIDLLASRSDSLSRAWAAAGDPVGVPH